MTDLFGDADLPQRGREDLAPGAVLLRGYAGPQAHALTDGIAAVAAISPFRHMVTRGGFAMSVAMTNCGSGGWVSDRRGYRYQALDPETGAPWPAMPAPFRALAQDAAAEAGYPGFAPDVCLINRYQPGAKMALHQDQDEADFSQPIVSVSLGLAAIFRFGGLNRSDPARKVPLLHGDVVVWGGPSRLYFHGIDSLKPGTHPVCGDMRLNLTFRRS
ncbi:DNA oxidative demethylase AlkB [Pseudomonas sp. GX19020]|uniref:DNA oxidative demethylase AlkB n=1 Tax=Pseudomonas sp. GX19020 TaxID=2942277 RepID=UPI0020193625|nr:DNA oxidative demethylase AlkB [Pseudomonas sp. GX19020]MCL4066004.1 DNA oxidative demethylase AlkB [Pseudomonas sp. GX19020]